MPSNSWMQIHMHCHFTPLFITKGNIIKFTIDILLYCCQAEVNIVWKSTLKMIKLYGSAMC